MPKQKKQIQGLPSGWIWMYKGERTWKTEDNVESDERHAYNPTTGQTLSVRQAQNLQREFREAEGKPKAPTVHRTGRIRTIKSEGARSKKVQSDVTKAGGVGSFYNMNRRGRTEVWIFRTFDDMRTYVYSQGLPDWASYAMPGLRYSERLETTDKVGSDVLDKNGYASLTGFIRPDTLQFYVDKTGSIGELPNPWDEAEDNLSHYDVSGEDARFYLYLAEN